MINTPVYKLVRQIGQTNPKDMTGIPADEPILFMLIWTASHKDAFVTTDSWNKNKMYKRTICHAHFHWWSIPFTNTQKQFEKIHKYFVKYASNTLRIWEKMKQNVKKEQFCRAHFHWWSIPCFADASTSPPRRGVRRRIRSRRRICNCSTNLNHILSIFYKYFINTVGGFAIVARI